jgi:hypothetical protein
MINDLTSKKKGIEEWAKHLFAGLSVAGILLLTTALYFISLYSLQLLWVNRRFSAFRLPTVLEKRKFETF